MTQKRLLLVDDEPTFLVAYGRILRAAGYAVEVAEDGQEALEVFERARFDVVVSDVNMPRMSGLELLPRIRALDPATVVILVTADPSDKLSREAAALGARAVFSKVVAAEALVAELGGNGAKRDWSEGLALLRMRLA